MPFAFRSNRGPKRSKAYPEKLTAADVPTLTSVLTIKEARGVDTTAKPFLVIVFEEFPDREYLTNAGQTAMFGDMVDAGYLPNVDDNGFASWAGRRIAFVKQDNKNPETGETVTKLYPVAANLQGETVEMFDARAEKKGKPKK